MLDGRREEVILKGKKRRRNETSVVRDGHSRPEGSLARPDVVTGKEHLNLTQI